MSTTAIRLELAGLPNFAAVMDALHDRLDTSSSILDNVNPLTRLREATEARAEAEAEWRDAIREAMDAERRAAEGYGVPDVVEAAGVSRPRVYQILEEGR